MEALERPKVEQKEIPQTQDTPNHILQDHIERIAADAEEALDKYTWRINLESNRKIEEALKEARSIVRRRLRDIKQVRQSGISSTVNLAAGRYRDARAQIDFLYAVHSVPRNE